MKIEHINDMVGGWFIGNFNPSVYKTEKFEICYKKHMAGDIWPKHYHKVATEINLLISGKMKIQETILTSGDIFTIFPYEIADPVFMEDCEIIIIKTPSIPGDKYEI